METTKNNKKGCWALILVAIITIVALFSNKTNQKSGNYVPPYRTQAGKLVKGHARKAHSTNPNATKNRQRSKSYHYLHRPRYALKNKKK